MNTRWRTVIKLVEKYPSNADYMVSKSSVKNFDTVNIIKSNWFGGNLTAKLSQLTIIICIILYLLRKNKGANNSYQKHAQK